MLQSQELNIIFVVFIKYKAETDLKVSHPEVVAKEQDISEFYKSWNAFVQSTTIHGLKYIFDQSSKSKLRRFVLQSINIYVTRGRRIGKLAD